jgi:hypothetical protein
VIARAIVLPVAWPRPLFSVVQTASVREWAWHETILGPSNIALDTAHCWQCTLNINSTSCPAVCAAYRTLPITVRRFDKKRRARATPHRTPPGHQSHRAVSPMAAHPASRMLAYCRIPQSQNGQASKSQTGCNSTMYALIAAIMPVMYPSKRPATDMLHVQASFFGSVR